MRDFRIDCSHRRLAPSPRAAAGEAEARPEPPSDPEDSGIFPLQDPGAEEHGVIEAPSENRIRAAAYAAVQHFDWKRLSSRFEHPFEAVVRYCRAVTRTRGRPKWAVQDFVLQEMLEAFRRGPVRGADLLHVAFRVIHGIADTIKAMCGFSRPVRRRMPPGKVAMQASVPGHPGVRLFLILRDVEDIRQDPVVCAIQTSGDFDRHARHLGRFLEPYRRPPPGSLGWSPA